MQAWIAGAMAVLGTLLVISGGAVIVSRALRPAVAGGEEVTGAGSAKTTARLLNAVRSMPPADRLIGWGIVLLVLGAVAAGAISFNVDAGAGTR